MYRYPLFRSRRHVLAQYGYFEQQSLSDLHGFAYQQSIHIWKRGWECFQRSFSPARDQNVLHHKTEEMRMIKKHLLLLICHTNCIDDSNPCCIYTSLCSTSYSAVFSTGTACAKYKEKYFRLFWYISIVYVDESCWDLTEFLFSYLRSVSPSPVISTRK